MFSTERPRIARYRINAASHLPRMISLSRSGDVTSSSMVPVRFSSANSRMVIMGMMNSPTTLMLLKTCRTTHSFTLSGTAWPIIVACRLCRRKYWTAVTKKKPTIRAKKHITP